MLSSSLYPAENPMLGVRKTDDPRKAPAMPVVADLRFTGTANA
jgi:hypothetical protein